MELETLRKRQSDIATRIEALEAEIAKTEPSAAPEKLKLVGVSALTRQDFAHYIDLQGKLATDQMYYVTPRGMGGQVKAVYVKQGDYVKRGQLLLKLDDAVLRQNIKQLESQLSFAKNIYERQKNLLERGHRHRGAVPDVRRTTSRASRSRSPSYESRRRPRTCTRRYRVWPKA